MGCCASTNGGPPMNRHVDISKSPPASENEEDEEEEAVKEVLSEKPISPNPYYYTLNTSVPKLTDHSSFTTSNNGYLSMNDSVHKTYLQSPRKQIDEIPDSRNRVVPRSPSPGRVNGEMGPRRGKSPVKRSDPSPRRSGSGRENPSPQRRREAGENSGRRSGSPVTRNVGRSSSGRKNGLSPGKIRMVQPGSGPGAGYDGGRRDSWETDPTAPNESLENPLVSLECFIFL